MYGRKITLFLCLLCFWTTQSPLWAQDIKVDRYFPSSTQIFISVSDVKALREHWRQTLMYENVSDVKYKEFRESIRQQIETAWPDRLGLKLSDLSTLPTGELGLGLVAESGKKPGFVVLMDVNGNASEVNDFIVRLIRQATSKNRGVATKERFTVGRKIVEGTLLTFPADEKHTTARTAYYVATTRTLVITDQKYLMETMLRKLAGETQNNLSSTPEYKAVFERCLADSKSNEAPQIRVYGNPLAAGEAIRSLALGKGRSPFAILARQGFDGIKSVGGTIDFSKENYEFVYRLKFYVPNPPKGALKALAFVNAPSLTPPDWVADNATRYTLASINAYSVFEGVGPLFDEFVETEGAWEEIMDQLEKDQVGPRVNLGAELFANLGRQFSSTNAFDPDNYDDGEKFVFAWNILEGKEQEVAGALKKMYGTDQDFTQVEIDNNVFWKSAPQTGAASSGVKRGSARPGARPSTRPTVGRRPTADSVAQAKADPDLIKGVVFGVAQGRLFVSNDAQYLEKKLQTSNASPILDSPSYQRALKQLAQEEASADGLFIQGYGRNIDGFRENYELFRQGKTPQGKTLSAKLFNLILSPPDQQGVREARFDGSKLPPFDESMAESVGYNLFFGVVEKDGYFLKGFSVRPE